MGKKDQYGIVTGIGGDVHRTFTTVAMRDAEGRVVRRERLDHRDRAGMLEQMRRWPSGLPLVVEASFGWGWVTDLALEAGLCPMLSNCYKVEQMRKARGLVKTNNKDAELLSQLMDEPKQWWRVWLAPTEVRDRREQMRSRTDLVRVSTQTKNRIHALFHRHGILHDFSDLFGARGRVFLGQLCLDGRTGPVRLEAGALEALRTQVRLLDHLRKQLADRTRTLRRQLQGDPLVARLTGIPGIGLILAHTLVAEIGRIERFANHRKLASYSLLGPRSDDTGEADSVRAPRGRHLGHRGNSTLQWAFIEAAHGAVRTGGRWRALFDRSTEGGTKDCNRGYIKVARELVTVVYVVWKKDVPYTDTPPARPGRPADASGSGASRSGTGQPFRPMAVVR